MTQEEKGKMRAVHFVPIFFILTFAWMFASILSYSSIEDFVSPPPYLLEESAPREPITETQPLATRTPKEKESTIIEPIAKTGPLATPAPWINVLIIIAAIGTMGLIFTLLMRKYKKFLRLLVPIFISLAGFSVAWFYLGILFIQTLHRFAFLEEWMTLWILPPFVSVLTLYVVLRKHGTLLALMILVAVATGAGASFATQVPFWTFLILLPAFSLYDIVMVSVGYLKSWSKAIEKEPRLLHGFIIEYRGRSFGFGDVFFYSALVAFAQLHFGIYAALLASCGILMGWYIIMLLIVKKGGVWPGLPAPLLLGGGLVFLSTLF